MKKTTEKYIELLEEVRTEERFKQILRQKEREREREDNPDSILPWNKGERTKKRMRKEGDNWREGV